MSGEWTDRERATRERAVRERVEREFAAEIAAVGEAADAVADRWDGDQATRREAAVDALRDRLHETGVAERLTAVAPAVADVLGVALPFDPVPRPPYLVVAAEGPMARVSFEEPPVRFVVLFRVFAVEPGDRSPRYRRTDGVAVDVSAESVRREG